MLDSLLAKIPLGEVKASSSYDSSTHTPVDVLRQLSSDFQHQHERIGHNELPQLRVGNIELARPTADDIERTLQDKKFPELFLSLCQNPDLLAATVKNKNIMDSIRPVCADEDIMKHVLNLYHKESVVTALETLKENQKFKKDVYPFIRPILEDKHLQHNLDATQNYIEGQKQSHIEGQRGPVRRLLSEYKRADQQKIESDQYETPDRRKPVIKGYSLQEAIIGGGFYLTATVCGLMFFGKFLYDQKQLRDLRIGRNKAFEELSRVLQTKETTIYHLARENYDLKHKINEQKLEYSMRALRIEHADIIRMKDDERKNEIEKDNYKRQIETLQQKNQTQQKQIEDQQQRMRAASEYMQTQEQKIQEFMDAAGRRINPTQGK